jgi:ABC-type multidrug transport system fused ATPase/permease subunit
VRDNVIFGSDYDDNRYMDTLDACELSKDLLSLPNADLTEIGERGATYSPCHVLPYIACTTHIICFTILYNVMQCNTILLTLDDDEGITLSGGQKARVNIARALYAPNKDLYLFDDPLAAVDVHVGKKIFDHALQKVLKGKARVLVLSSNYHLLPHCDRIVVVSMGKVDVCGSYADMKEKYPEYSSRDGEATALENTTTPAAVVLGAKSVDGGSDDDEDENDDCDSAENGHADALRHADEANGSEDSIREVVKPTGFAAPDSTKRLGKMKKSYSMYRSHYSLIAQKQLAGTVLTTTEDRQKGGVSLSTYWQYFSSSVDPSRVWEGYITVVVVVILFTIGQATRVFCDMWVGLWASNADKTHPDHSTSFFILWYIILVVVTAMFVFGRAQYFVLSCIRASRSLHHTLLDRLLGAPVNTYFDVTPVGRILNRFSKDLDAMDSMLPDFFLQNVQNTFHIISVLILCIIASPYFIIMAIFLGAIFGYIQHMFSMSSREIKRLEGVTRSPIYSGFSEMLMGLPTIRAYKKEDTFMEGHCKVADANNKSLFSYWVASRWLALRLDFVSNMTVVTVALIAVIVVQEGGSVNPTTLGLALVYSLQLASFLQWTVRCAIETENNMTAVERLLEFSKVPAEAARTTAHDPDIEKWPVIGAIVMEKLSLRYRPDLSCVLNKVTLNIPGRCKVGVCGRTGAGMYVTKDYIA